MSQICSSYVPWIASGYPPPPNKSTRSHSPTRPILRGVSRKAYLVNCDDDKQTTTHTYTHTHKSTLCVRGQMVWRYNTWFLNALSIGSGWVKCEDFETQSPLVAGVDRWNWNMYNNTLSRVKWWGALMRCKSMRGVWNRWKSIGQLLGWFLRDMNCELCMVFICHLLMVH